MTPIRPLLLAALAGLLAAGCATTTPAPALRVRPLRQQHVTTITVSREVSPRPVSHDAWTHRSRRNARTVVAGFAAAYLRYLNGRLSVDRLPGLSAAARGSVEQTRPSAVRLRVISLDDEARSWTIRYAATSGRRRGIVTARVILAWARGGWGVARIDPPDLDQIAASQPTPLAPPQAVRTAALAFMRGYLAYTYAHAPATALTHLTPALRRQLTTWPPTVPAAVRARRPRINRLALAHPTRASWVARAQVSDGANFYTVDSTLTHAQSGWVVRRVAADG